MGSRKYISILIILSGVTTIACVGQSWDATKDFGSINPNGAWSYGSGFTGTSFALDTLYEAQCNGVTGDTCWKGAGSAGVGFNTTGALNIGTAVDPPDTLHVHPGPSDGQDAILQWTAPFTGTFNVSGISRYSTPTPLALSDWFSRMARKFTA